MPAQLTPLDTIRVAALTASYDALDTVLYGIGTQFKKGNYNEATYNMAEAELSADMKKLSDKVEAITGEPLAVFAI